MMEYFIEELAKGGKVSHGSTFSGIEAGKLAADIQLKRGNPVTVTPVYVPNNQIENSGAPDAADKTDFKPITAQELYEDVHGAGAILDEQSFRTKIIYGLLAENANDLVAEYGSEIIDGGSVSSEGV